jgi:phage gpG-like protein
MTVDEYVRGILGELPKQLKDVFNAQVMQTAVAKDISDNYGAKNRNPTYPRQPEGTTLQFVTGKLYKAATVYKAPGNESRTVVENKQVTFEWGIDLEVVPYARIHEYGGETGRNKATTLPKRPYIGPALTAFEKDTLPDLLEILFERLLRGK